MAADRQEKAELTSGYFNNTLLPDYAQRYGPVLKSCFATVVKPDSSPFSFVAALDADGRVTRLYRNGDTNISRCLLSTLEKDSFPAPPETPYYLHVDMRFDGDGGAPQQRDSSKDAPPLIVGPNKYSYTFGVPTNWEFNFEQAHARGAELAFFPIGGNFNGSSSVIYVSEIDTSCDGCLSPIDESIAKTLREVKEESPSVLISSGDPIRTKDGAQAKVRILKGSSDPRNPALKDNEALAFIGHEETTVLVVLTARDPSTWDQDFNAFQKVIAGHKFFNCNTPDLAVPCSR